MLEKLEATLLGVSPLLMNNGRGADPTDELTRQLKPLTIKKPKTDEVLSEIRRLEWARSLYLDADGRLAIPADNILAAVIEGARKSKLGKDAEAGVFDSEPFYQIHHEGPKDLDRLYVTPGFCDYRGVVVARRRTMRARARVPAGWRLPIALMVNTEIIEVRAVVAALEAAGERIGLGDYRPRFGRFTVEIA